MSTRTARACGGDKSGAWRKRIENFCAAGWQCAIVRGANGVRDVGACGDRGGGTGHPDRQVDWRRYAPPPGAPAFNSIDGGRGKFLDGPEIKIVRWIYDG